MAYKRYAIQPSKFLKLLQLARHFPIVLSAIRKNTTGNYYAVTFFIASLTEESTLICAADPNV